MAHQIVIEGLEIDGGSRARGRDIPGLVLEAVTAEGLLHNVCLRDVSVDRCSGDGCRLIGNICEAQIMNCYFSRNQNGILLKNSGTAAMSSIHMLGCSFDQNLWHGVQAAADPDAGVPHDIGFTGCYFAENGKFGAELPAGCAYMTNCVVENNWSSAASPAGGNAGISLGQGCTMIGCAGNGTGQQTHLVRAQVSGALIMVGCSVAGTGSRLCHLSGPAGAKARIIGCRGIREYSGAMAGEATEIANVP